MSEVHIHLHLDGYAPVKPAQVEEAVESTESDQDKEYRLMAKYADRNSTLTEDGTVPFDGLAPTAPSGLSVQ